MKAVKIAAMIIGGVLLLMAIGVAVIASRFDGAWVKQQLVGVVQEQKQRQLRIDGDLALSFFPYVGLKLGRTSLSERNSDQEFAAIEAARVAVKLWPLLSRQLVVDRIELSGVRANIVRTKTGSFNFDDLLSKSETETPLLKFDIAGIALKNSAISYRDEKDGRNFNLSSLTLETGRLANGAEGPLELAFALASREPDLKGNFSLKGRYRYDLEKRQYDFEQANASVTADIQDFKGLDLTLEAKQLGFQTDQAGVRVEGLVATARGQLADGSFEAGLIIPSLAMVADRASGQEAVARLKFDGKRHLEAKLEISGLEGSASLLKIQNLGAQWDFKQDQWSAKGGLAGGMQANVKDRVLDLPKMNGLLEIASPDLPMRQVKLPFDAAFHADWGKSRAAGNLSARLDESSIRAQWQLSRLSPLALGFDLGIDRLNIDKYFPPAKPAPGGEAGAATGPEGAIDLSPLRGLDIKGAVRIDFLQVNNAKINNLKAEINLGNSRLDISPLSADLYGGSLAGSLSAQVEGNRLALRQSVNNIVIDALLKDVARKDIVAGKGDVILDVSTSGKTLTTMKQGLAGAASLHLRDGAVKGINLAKSVRELKASLSGRQDVVVNAKQTEKTDFSELTATFRIAGGIAHNEDLSAKSPYLRASGAGDIDFAHSRIDYLAKATVVGTAKGQEGQELEQLKGLTLPVRLTGPFDHLAYKLEFGAMAADVAKQQVQKQVDKQLEKKGLGDVFKGLFK